MDYSKYERKRQEWMKLVGIWGGISILFGWIFYKNWIGMICIFPFVIVYEKIDRKKKMEARKNKLSEQFVEALQTMISALKAGNSIEKSIFAIRERLKEVYGEEELIMKEFLNIERGLKMNVTIEEMFMDFGKRSQVEDIKEFAEVLSVAKRAGANLVRVMENTAEFIVDKRETEREIRVLITGKKMEGKVMGYILPGMLFYLNLAMPSVSASLYHNTSGVLFMTGILFGYLICLLWFDKMSEIRM